MEAVGLYLLRSAVWLTGFALVYSLVLRNERFFLLNRVYLVFGILASVILPLLTVRYVVEVPVMQADVTAGALTGTVQDSKAWQHILALVLSAVWLTGAIVILLRYAVQVYPVLRAAGKADLTSGYPVKVIRTSEFRGSFSLFSLVVVNPSVSETEAREIMNHEMVHIRQMHSFDLVLTSLLCAVQWFNPVSWIYSGFIRQNHEYLADEEALQRTSDPAVYRAVLLNQIAGSPVIDLGNFFSQSLNKKRFLMMKNKISSPYRKLRLLFILPVAALVLFAFAEPQYRVAAGESALSPSSVPDADIVKKISGMVTDEKGNPLEGAVVVLKGTTIGTTTDASGKFTLGDVPDDATLVVSYVGYVTKAIMANAITGNVTISLKWGNLITDTVNVAPPPPPPPPPGSMSSDALVVLDGKVTTKSFTDIPPERIQKINILKGESAVTKYGDKARNGVIEIYTREDAAGKAPATGEVKVTGYGKEKSEDVFVVVEEMPQFPGGQEAMMLWISQRIRYPEQAKKEGITGGVFVSFVVNKTGKVENVKVEKSAHPLLDAEAVRVIGEMPQWKPGSQRGKNVDVRITVPVNFALK